MSLNINNKELVQLTNKLEKLHKSALPIAVRSTLNDLAFDSKQKFVQKEFDKQFTIRKRNFIKSHTTVNKCKNTFNINEMVSEMGVIKGKSKAGDKLDKQEFGGTIKGRDYIPTQQARVSKSSSKLVSKKYYRTKMNAKNKKPITKWANLSKAANHFGKGSIFLFNKVLVEVKSITKRGKIKLKNLYSFEKGRSVRVKKSPFLAPSANRASKNIYTLFEKNAQRQFNKYL